MDPIFRSVLYRIIPFIISACISESCFDNIRDLRRMYIFVIISWITPKPTTLQPFLFTLNRLDYCNSFFLHINSQQLNLNSAALIFSPPTPPRSTGVCMLSLSLQGPSIPSSSSISNVLIRFGSSSLFVFRAGSLATSMFDRDSLLVGASSGVYALIAAHLVNILLVISMLE